MLALVSLSVGQALRCWPNVRPRLATNSDDHVTTHGGVKRVTERHFAVAVLAQVGHLFFRVAHSVIALLSTLLLLCTPDTGEASYVASSVVGPCSNILPADA